MEKLSLEQRPALVLHKLIDQVLVETFLTRICGSCRTLDPRVLHDLCTSKPFFRVQADHFWNQIFAWIRKALRGHKRAFLYLSEKLLHRSSIERVSFAQQEEHTNPKWPNITLLIVFACQDLWGYEVRSTNDLFFVIDFLCSYREPKIDKLDVAVLAKHDIFWLDIPMKNVLSMAMLQRISHFAQVTCHCFLIIIIDHPGPYHFLRELSTFAKLHHQVNILFVFVSLMVLDNIGVVDLLQNLNFWVKIIDLFLI